MNLAYTIFLMWFIVTIGLGMLCLFNAMNMVGL